MGHMRKMQSYEVVMMPERKSQTAGLSMPNEERAPDNVGMVKVCRAMLIKSRILTYVGDDMRHLLEFLMQRLADTK